jgi:hypothetical protein
MATRVFPDEELAQLRSFPEITRDELIRFFTLPSPDRAFVDPGRGRSARDRLGLAVRLCTLLWVDPLTRTQTRLQSGRGQGVVRLVRETGKPIAQVARELGSTRDAWQLVRPGASASLPPVITHR